MEGSPRASLQVAVGIPSLKILFPPPPSTYLRYPRPGAGSQKHCPRRPLQVLPYHAPRLVSQGAQIFPSIPPALLQARWVGVCRSFFEFLSSTSILLGLCVKVCLSPCSVCPCVFCAFSSRSHCLLLFSVSSSSLLPHSLQDSSPPTPVASAQTC